MVNVSALSATADSDNNTSSSNEAVIVISDNQVECRPCSDGN